MVYQESDDLIGLGDAGAFFSKVKKGIKKVRGVVRRVAGKVSKARGRGAAVVEAARGGAAPEGTVVEAAPASGGVVQWARQNPVIVAGAALALVLLMRRKR